MILGAEIGLCIYGLYALIQGRLNLWTGRDLEGTPARVLGAVAMVPIVLAFVVGLVLGAVTRGDPARMASLSTSFPWIELGILVACVAAIYGIGWPLSGRPAPRRVLGSQLPGRSASVPGRPGAPRPSGTSAYSAPNRMAPVGRPNRHDRSPLTRILA